MIDPSNSTGSYPDTGAHYAEKEVNHHIGLEVDHTQNGLRTVLGTAGLEALPAEHRNGVIPQTSYDGPEKEAWNNVDKEITYPEGSKTPQRQSILKRRWKLWALLAALLVIIVVIAIAVPLSLQDKSR